MGNDQSYFEYDTIILGAGINGCAIADELARAGKNVVVLEKNTIGSGTSSKSSRLIHGGLRYLEQFQIGLVREALLDRQELLRKYPSFVKMKPFYLPVYSSSPRPAWMIWSGLKLYDILTGRYVQYKSRIIDRKFFSQFAPSLKEDGLKAVFQYFDAKTDDLLLTQTVAEDAQKAGADVHQFVEIDTIKQTDTNYIIHSNRGIFTAPLLVNATGPWIDEVNERYGLHSRYHIRKISGIHVIFPGLLTHDLLFMQTVEKRIFFIIPEPTKNQTIIGTTEREELGTMDDVKIHPDDVDYLIRQLNAYLKPECQVSPDKIKSSYIGVRPLIAHKDNPTDLSREYVLDLQENNAARLLHVFGGKITTYLSLARQAKRILQQVNDH